MLIHPDFFLSTTHFSCECTVVHSYECPLTPETRRSCENLAGLLLASIGRSNATIRFAAVREWNPSMQHVSVLGANHNGFDWVCCRQTISPNN